VLGLGLALGLGLVNSSSLVGVCRHLAAVVSVTYTTVLYTTIVSIVDLWSILHKSTIDTTVVSVVCRHDGRVRNIHDRRVHDGRVYSGSVEYTRRSCP